jgi:GDP-L-fucose synthase
MVGSAVSRYLSSRGEEVLKADREIVDLRNEMGVEVWLKQNRPDAIIFLPPRSAGSTPTKPIQRTSSMTTWRSKRTLFIPHIWPALTVLYLHLCQGCSTANHGRLPTDGAAGADLRMAHRKQYGRHYISIMPRNLYGPGDNFDLMTGHVVSTLINKFHAAKIRAQQEVVVWGIGSPLREFLHVDDLARAVVFCLDNYDDYQHINCGAGSEVSIRNLAEILSRTVEHSGQIVYDKSKPDGTPRKLMDSSRIAALGWNPKISLEDGIRYAYQWYLENRLLTPSWRLEQARMFAIRHVHSN